MSTHGYIGRLRENGTVAAVYHHWDSYLEGLGRELIDYYMNPQKVERLINLGDISIIGHEPIGYWSDTGADETKCKTYRERGEFDVDTKYFRTEEDYINRVKEEFVYLFKDGDWYFKQYDETEWRLVRDYLDTD